jgi:cysteinyl-tRNA synthetase
MRVAEWSRHPDVQDAGAERFESRFREALADDLDLPAAMALLSELTRSDVAPGAKAALLRSWDRVLGLDLDRPGRDDALPEGAGAMLEARQRARAARDFQTSDRLRGELAALGVTVTDTADGQRWKTSR